MCVGGGRKGLSAVRLARQSAVKHVHGKSEVLMEYINKSRDLADETMFILRRSLIHSNVYIGLFRVSVTY